MVVIDNIINMLVTTYNYREFIYNKEVDLMQDHSSMSNHESWGAAKQLSLKQSSCSISVVLLQVLALTIFNFFFNHFRGEQRRNRLEDLNFHC